MKYVEFTRTGKALAKIFLGACYRYARNFGRRLRLRRDKPRWCMVASDPDFLANHDTSFVVIMLTNYSADAIKKVYDATENSMYGR